MDNQELKLGSMGTRPGNPLLSDGMGFSRLVLWLASPPAQRDWLPCAPLSSCHLSQLPASHHEYLQLSF